MLLWLFVCGTCNHQLVCFSYPSVIIYIGYICCRNRRARPSSANTNRVADKLSCKSPTEGKSQSCSLNDDVRENIVCYRDEGGGEDDVRAYDMIALRIQIPTNMAPVCNNNNNSNKTTHFEDLGSEHGRVDKSTNFGECTVQCSVLI